MSYAFVRVFSDLGIPSVGRDVLCFRQSFFFFRFLFFFCHSAGTNLGLAVVNFPRMAFIFGIGLP